MANFGLLSDPIFLLIAIVLADVPAHASSEQPAGQRSGRTCRWADKEDQYDNMFVVKLMQ